MQDCSADAHGASLRQPPELFADAKGPWDLGIVVSFGYLIPTRLIRHFALGTLNVHPSLLPLYRGAAPIQHAILNGDRETGVSIIGLSEGKFDSGRIYKQTRTPIAANGETFEVLHDRLAEQGARNLEDVVANFPHFNVGRLEVVRERTSSKILQSV